MEQKLAEFRARRHAENMAKKDKCAGPPCRTETVDDGVKAPQTDRTTAPPPTATTPDSQQTQQETGNGRDSPQSSPRKDRSDWFLDSSVGRWLASRQLVITNLTLLKVLLWLVLLGLFVELEFGLPFFVISLFYWLYEGLRSPAAREPGELSAYSVFNPDCQPLLGTLTAEQLEGEMGYRPLTNR